MAKTLITGINGFVGSYLLRHLLDAGCEVVGLDRGSSCDLSGAAYHAVDILDTEALRRLLENHGPEEIYHLAGVSYLPEADASPMRALNVNILGTVSLLEAVRRATPRARVLLVGSSREYGVGVDSSGLIGEDARPWPSDFYGVSKFTGELLGMQYWRQYGLDIRMSRSFNHTGPGQPSRFVCSDWARQVAEIKLVKSAPVIRVGNIEAVVDFTDVRDVVRAYRAILRNGTPGETYNVCSGRALPLRLILDHLRAKAGCPVEVIVAPQKLRSHSTCARLVGSHAKLTSVSGWMPEIAMEKTLDEIFDYWMHKLTSGKP